jgi:hypothetical protein
LVNDPRSEPPGGSKADFVLPVDVLGSDLRRRLLGQPQLQLLQQDAMLGLGLRVA